MLSATSFRGAAVAPRANRAAPSARRAILKVRAGDGIDATVDALVGAVKASGAALKAAVPVVQDAITEATPVVTSVVQKAAPVFQEGARVTGQLAAEAAKVAAPLAADAARVVPKIDIDSKSPVVQTTALVAGEAGTLAKSTATYLAAQSPETLVEYGAAAVALYFLAPPLLGLASGAFRGYKDDLSPPQALDLLLSEGDSVLIDLRSAREKESSGVIDVPGSAASKVIELEFATTEDRKVRGLLRDAFAVEAKITALQIAALRRVSRGSKVILMDGAGGNAKAVAKELGLGRGFGNVYVLSGGFRSWVSSKLETRVSRSVSTPTVVAESVTVVKPARPAKSTTTVISAGSQRSLPAPKK